MGHDSSRTAVLRITETWFGEPLGDETHVRLTRAGVGGGLRIDIDAPFHRNPPPPTDHPDDGPSRCFDGLWNHEVVELFIGTADGPGKGAYIELEFGPFGHALGLRFGAYRQRTGLVDLPGEAAIDGDRWRAVAFVDAADLPPEPWELNAFVIFDRKTERIYGASFPNSGDHAPDFHHRRTWRVTTLG